MDEAPPTRLDETTSGGRPAPRSISSGDLLAGERMIMIRHGTELYRLQVTSGGKLILTK